MLQKTEGDQRSENVRLHGTGPKSHCDARTPFRRGADSRWDGINCARNERPDLIVMDVKLPDISGLDATLLLKKDDQTKDIPIIAVTACATPGDKANALKSGCAAYIAKPVDIDNLLRTVESFLPSSSPW